MGSAPPSFNLTSCENSTPATAERSPPIKAVESVANTSEDTAYYKHLKLMDDAQKMFQSQDSCKPLVSDQRRSNRIHKAPLWHQNNVLEK